MAMDVVGPIPTSARGNDFILVMNEYLTRCMIAAPMPDQKAETVKDTFIDSVILEYGVPERVLTDQGKGERSQLGQNFSFCNISCLFHFFLIFFFRVFR